MGCRSGLRHSPRCERAFAQLTHAHVECHVEEQAAALPSAAAAPPQALRRARFWQCHQQARAKRKEAYVGHRRNVEAANLRNERVLRKVLAVIEADAHPAEL